MSSRTDSDLGPQDVTAWVGWVMFASVMMFLSGAFTLTWGFAALFRKEVFVTGPHGNTLSWSYTAAGWTALIIGAFVILTAVALLSGRTWARIVAIVAAGVSALSHLLTIGSDPIWAITVIAIDVLIIYAISVHGSEMRKAPGEF